MMQEYWFALFDEATTSHGEHVIAPLSNKVIVEYFGRDVSKIFAQWFVQRRRAI